MNRRRYRLARLQIVQLHLPSNIKPKRQPASPLAVSDLFANANGNDVLGAEQPTELERRHGHFWRQRLDPWPREQIQHVDNLLDGRHWPSFPFFVKSCVSPGLSRAALMTSERARAARP